MGVNSTNYGALRPGVTTSTTLPAAPYDGQVVSLTDTDSMALYNGAAWQGIPQTAGFRNAVINGGFDVWQRGSAVRYNSNSSNLNAYAADQWCGGINSQNVRTQQTTASLPISSAGSLFAIRCSSSTVAESAIGTRMWLTQKIFNEDSSRFVSKTVTLSFWARFSAATLVSTTAAYGDFVAVIGAYTGTTNTSMSSANYDSSIASISVTAGTLPTSWTKYAVTGTAPSNLKNISVNFQFGGLGNTTSADTTWYEIAEVQLEQGFVATPFERRPLAVEFPMCQRYFRRYDVGPVGNGIAIGTTRAFIMIYHPNMRVGPTVTPITVGGFSLWGTSAGNSACTTLATYSQTQHQTVLDANCGAAVMLNGGTGHLWNNTSTLDVSAEMY